MPTYNVTILARVTKTLTVEADNEQAAVEMAHEGFSVLPEDDTPEDYDEETVNVVQATGD